MSDEQSLQNDKSSATIYEIRLEGHLSPRWEDIFEGLTFTLEDSGETRLTGVITDQAALHGVLKQIRDLGLTLIEVKRITDAE